MTTKEMQRAIGTLDDALTWNGWIIVALGLGLFAFILEKLGVARSGDLSLPCLLMAILFAAGHHKSLRDSREGLRREYRETLERSEPETRPS
jgi:hypothetical protein